jgi:hypothetical protein
MTEDRKIDDFIHGGWTAEDVRNAPKVAFTPAMAEEAYHGLAGRIVQAVAPYSEADPVAILANVLAGAGNLIGRGVHAMVECTLHTCNEFMVFVGQTSKGRKGQSWGAPRQILTGADEGWAKTRIKHGLSSGEGVIYNVRDERIGVDKKGQRVVEDEGEADKRLLVFEPEFSTVLRRMQGETNSLSAVLREAWESGDLSTLTKNSPLRATGAHISVIAHTTREELVASLTETDRANGFANRFIYLLVQRAQELPEMEAFPADVLTPFTEEMREVATWARSPRRVARDVTAKGLWAKVYHDLSEGEPGLIGAILGRSEAHALRLSLIYAALDRSPEVRVEHLKAALAVWDYADKSARRIFGDVLGLTVADTILAALLKRGSMTKTKILRLFGSNKSESEISVVLSLLQQKGLVKKTMREPEGGRGRPAEVWEAVQPT